LVAGARFMRSRHTSLSTVYSPPGSAMRRRITGDVQMDLNGRKGQACLALEQDRRAWP
jgi:hypothetical protein